jgi:hypothetical protein
VYEWPLAKEELACAGVWLSRTKPRNIIHIHTRQLRAGLSSADIARQNGIDQKAFKQSSPFVYVCEVCQEDINSRGLPGSLSMLSFEIRKSVHRISTARCRLRACQNSLKVQLVRPIFPSGISCSTCCSRFPRAVRKSDPPGFNTHLCICIGLVGYVSSVATPP